MRRLGHILDRGAEPFQRCTEILLAFAVETLLVGAEARDTGADFARHIAWCYWTWGEGCDRRRYFHDPGRFDRCRRLWRRRLWRRLGARLQLRQGGRRQDGQFGS